MWIPLSIKKQDFILELKKRLKCVKHGKKLEKPVEGQKLKVLP